MRPGLAFRPERPFSTAASVHCLFRPLFEVLLFANLIGLSDPADKLRIEVGGRIEPELVFVAPRRMAIDSQEPGVFDSTRQQQAADQIRFPRHYRGKPDASLKCDPGFLRDYSYGTARASDIGEPVEGRENVRFAAGEERSNAELPAGVREVAGHKPLAAPGTLP